MDKIQEIILAAKTNPADVMFADICRVCDHFFGEPRQQGTSHRVYKLPWQGDPRVNIQRQGNKAKAYQVRQVLKAIDRLEENRGK
ncbi:MAG: toxin HicA [Desulfobacteraceae bacterium]|nr:toxin HicA [Desulfobacteraceae bacterium]